MQGHPFWEGGALVWCDQIIICFFRSIHYAKCPFVLFFQSSWCRISSAAWNWINSVPQPAATTFAFSSVWFFFYGWYSWTKITTTCFNLLTFIKLNSTAQPFNSFTMAGTGHWFSWASTTCHTPSASWRSCRKFLNFNAGKSEQRRHFNFVYRIRRVRVSGSLIGGMKETQECIDFCAKNNIKPTTQV